MDEDEESQYEEEEIEEFTNRGSTWNFDLGMI